MRRMVLVVALVGLLAAACGGSASSSSAKYCDSAQKLSQDIKITAQTDYRVMFQQFDTFADKFLSTAPAEIKADANTVISEIRQLETVFRGVNYDVTKVDAAKLQALSNPNFAASAGRIGAYTSKHCEITTPTT